VARKRKPGVSFITDVSNGGGGFTSSASFSFASLSTPFLPS
jgi:hypothetical protein